jgi:predicted O-methyltransferase YrrM
MTNEISQYVNWFSNDGEPNFSKVLLSEYVGKKIRCLQIGSYTGDASVWMLDNILKHPDSVLVDVDTWEGSEEPVHYEMNWHTVESLYDIKTSAGRADRKIVKYKGTSDDFFKNNREMYDFIYIDGDHTAYGVLKDAVAAYECLTIGGIIAFDDYQWSAGLGAIKEPKMAIDAFNSIYFDRVEEILNGYQRWFKKVR